jgi:hypothetical protein
MEELGLDQTQKPPLFTINVTARTLYAFHQVQHLRPLRSRIKSSYPTL